MEVSAGLIYRRKIRNAVALTLATAATVFGLIWLCWILWTTLSNGAAALGPKLFTQMTPPPGEDGGLLNAFYGSFIMTTLAVVIGTPIGIAAGAYLSEFARRSRLGLAIRFVNDILLSAPSIVVGLFIYEVVVRPMGHFSALAGGLALAFDLAARGGQNHGRDVAAGAERGARSRLVAGSSAVESRHANRAAGLARESSPACC